MSNEERTGGYARFSRRQFLAMGLAGAGALAFGGTALGQSLGPNAEVIDSVSYRGHKVSVVKTKGSEEELRIDGEHIRTIHSSGVYLADGFVSSPEPTLKELGKRVVDARRAYAARGVKKGVAI